ncbi:sugar phosphate isomerase/epimerase [soil metagenome]
MKYAICNETFEGWSHTRICGRIAELGYRGLEIAPYTQAPLITDVTAAKRAELKREADAAGVTILGLHWLLKNTVGFYLTSPDASVQQRTGEYFAELARTAAELGGDILVLGSPLQRNLLPGVTQALADDYAAATLSHCLKSLADNGVTLCLEPLGPAETNYMNTAAEAVALIDKLGHPNVKLHLDVKAMADEPKPTPQVIRDNATYTRHFHANDPNRRGPGFGDVRFEPIFQALNETKYDGWVSVEVFDYTPDPDTIARESIRYLKECHASAMRR